MIEHAAAGRPAGFLGIAATATIGLLPKLTCPVCWPAYTALLSAFGLGFVDYTPYLFLLTASFIAVSLAALAWTARARRTLTPLIAGALTGSGLLLGKFALESDALTYAAIALFVVAPFLPLRRRREPACPNCLPTPKESI